MKVLTKGAAFKDDTCMKNLSSLYPRPVFQAAANDLTASPCNQTDGEIIIFYPAPDGKWMPTPHRWQIDENGREILVPHDPSAGPVLGWIPQDDGSVRLGAITSSKSRLPPVPAPATNQNLPYEAVCSIQGNEGYGQGSFIAPNYVLTALHVAPEGGHVKVINSEGVACYGRTIIVDKDHDLAIVELDQNIGKSFIKPPEDKSVYVNQDNTLKPGIDLQIVTQHPVEGRAVIRVEPAYPSQWLQVGGSNNIKIVGYTASRNIIQGHSGSPLVDKDGHIVSVASASAIGTHIFMAPPLSAMQSLFREFSNYLRHRNMGPSPVGEPIVYRPKAACFVAAITRTSLQLAA